MKFKALIFAAFLIPVQAFAADGQFADGAPVTLQPDQAYILVRTFHVDGGGLHGTSMFAPVLARVLSQPELERAKTLSQQEPGKWMDDIPSNVVEPLADHPYLVQDDKEYMLMSLKPGEYVIAGIAVTNWAAVSTGLMATSLCMGTVKFEARPGVITDLGAIFTARDDEPTEIPELSKVVSGKPRGFGVYPVIAAIRPAAPAADIPDALKNLPIEPATYRPVGAFPNYLGARISRLAPIPGVLDYDKDGNVIDLKAANATSAQTLLSDAPPAGHSSVATPETPDTPSPSPRTHLPSRP